MLNKWQALVAVKQSIKITLDFNMQENAQRDINVQRFHSKVCLDIVFHLVLKLLRFFVNWISAISQSVRVKAPRLQPIIKY